MEISVDGEKPFVLQSNPETVGAALVEVNAYLEARGRALQSIVADGRNVPAEEITGGFGRLAVADVALLEIASADTVALVDETLAELKEVLPELPVACQGLAEALGGEAPQEAFASFNQLLEIWEALAERRGQILGALGVSAEGVRVGKSSLEELNLKLGETLDRARKAMEKSDFPVLAELLAYELAPLAEGEADILAALERLRQDGV